MQINEKKKKEFLSLFFPSFSSEWKSIHYFIIYLGFLLLFHFLRYFSTHKDFFAEA